MGITQLADGSLAVAARDGAVLLDPDTGVQRARVDYEGQAGVLGVMRWAPAGAQGYAVAFTWTGSAEPQTRSLVAFDGSNRVGPVMLPSNVRYVTSHPTQTERYLAVRDIAGMSVIESVDGTGATTRWLNDVSFLQAAHTVFVQIADDVAVVLCDNGGSGPMRLVRTRPVVSNDCELLDGSSLGVTARMSDLTLVTR